MAAISVDPRFSLQANKTLYQHGEIVEEIEGLIKVYKDGRVERPNIIPNVPCTVSSELRVSSKDIVLQRATNLWARIYVPACGSHQKLPLLVYFHGGGFCVGSSSWSCYHNFLCNLSSTVNCVILSVNYRLAPESRLPAAYEDGYNSIMWVKQQALAGSSDQKWWLDKCNFSSLFIGGDSAGANIAYNVVIRQLGSNGCSYETNLKPFSLKGIILIQPFFGGEARTMSEQYSNQPTTSALTLKTSDTYWRLALPPGASRDHPWCNPLGNGCGLSSRLRLPSVMVCISEMDILKDRNCELSAALAKASKRVETVLFRGVGHAFQILHNSDLSQARKHEMMSRIKAFMHQ